MTLPPTLQCVRYSANSGAFEFEGNSLNAVFSEFDPEELIDTLIGFVKATGIEPAITITASASVTRTIESMAEPLKSVTWIQSE